MFDILQKRRILDYDDVTLSLFHTCNLGCKFCYLKNLNINKNNFLIEKDKILQSAKQQIDEFEYKNIELKILGGELFSDNVPDNLFEDYFLICKELYEYTKKQNKEIVFNFTSNLVHTKNERVMKLFNRLKELNNKEVILGTSFDFFDRFKTDEQLDLFMNNTNIYKKYIKKINVILTLKTYKLLISKEIINEKIIKCFNKLYNNFRVCLSNQIPINNYDDVITDEQKTEIYFYMVDNYPKVYPIDNLIKWKGGKQIVHCNPIKNEIDCYGNRSISCMLYNYYERTDIDRKKIELEALKARGCLSCEYYDRCILPCLYGTYMKKDNLSVCYLKEVIKYIIDKNKSI